MPKKIPRNIMAGTAGQSRLQPATAPKIIGKTIIKAQAVPKGNTN